MTANDQSFTHALLQDAANRAMRFVDDLDERSVAPGPDAVARLDELMHALPAEGIDATEILRLADEYGSRAAMGMAGPRFFGFVTGGTLPASLAVHWLATAWDQNVSLFEATPFAAVAEAVSERWMVDLLGLPAETVVAFVTGCTMAHFTALAAARQAVLMDAGWDVREEGLFGAPRVTVVVGEEAHATLVKVLGLLGFGRSTLVWVPVDSQGRMRADALPEVTGPTIVCVQAGNVNTGAVDPLREIIPWARARGAWVHVDGAFGLWAKTASDRAGLLEGMELADSWATDGHKWLNVPYDSGLAFVRDRQALAAVMALSTAYFREDRTRREPARYTPESSRRARGVDLWAALLSLGRNGVGALVERNCRQAARFAEGLREAGYEILNDVVLNQVLVSFGTPAETLAVVAAIKQDGTCWCGSTVWQGKTAMRISVSSWATTDADVERSLAAMIAIARQLVPAR